MDRKNMMTLIRRLACVAMAVMLMSATVAAAGEVAPPLVTTTGRAVVYVVPDEIVVSFGVSSRNMSLTKAKAENDTRTRKVLTLAPKFKIAPNDVQTSYLNIKPLYTNQYNDREPGKFLGYSVSNTIVFTLRSVSQLESLVGEALEAGANEVNSIQFQTSESRKHMDKARLMAIQTAKEKATALANALGMSLGHPYTIEEVPPYAYGNMLAQSVSNAFAFDGEGAGTAGSTFAVGQIEISAKVTVAFRLKAPGE